MTIICDATSLILLAKVDLLEIFVKRNNVIVPKLVYDEVIKGKEKGRGDSMLVQRLVIEKHLSVKYVNKSLKNKIEKLFNLRGGEQEVIALAFKKKHTILSDDKKCLNAAKALKIDFITSLDVILALYKKGAISKERALECIDTLEDYGWYAKNLIQNYKEAIK